ncbi:MAG: helix-turn-helix domain-containing protein [Chloroflexota bacterium]
MSAKRFPIQEKMRIVWLLREKTYDEISVENDVSVATIRRWQKQYDDIAAEYYTYIHDEAVHRVLLAQLEITKKLKHLVDAIDKNRINTATLNQLSSAIGVFIDRFLRIHNAKDITPPDTGSIRIAYINEHTGEITDAPPWTTANPDASDPLHSGFLWQALRQDRPSEDHHHRNGVARETDMVARADVSDGTASLAGLEADDDKPERNWDSR